MVLAGMPPDQYETPVGGKVELHGVVSVLSRECRGQSNNVFGFHRSAGMDIDASPSS